MAYNRYAIPKPIGRDYTEDEEELVEDIKKAESEYYRSEKAKDNAYSHYNQVSNKYKNKPITPEPPFFVRGNTHPDPEEYKRLLKQEARNREETGQEERLKHMSLIGQRDMEAHRAHMIRSQKLDMLRDLIKKNDRMLNRMEMEEDRKRKKSKPKPKRKPVKKTVKKVVKKCKCK